LVADQVVEDDHASGAMSAVPLLSKHDWTLCAVGMLQTFSTASINGDGYAASACFRPPSKSGVMADMPAPDLCATSGR
jgi:hypothetical protein